MKVVGGFFVLFFFCQKFVTVSFETVTAAPLQHTGTVQLTSRDNLFLLFTFLAGMERQIGCNLLVHPQSALLVHTLFFFFVFYIVYFVFFFSFCKINQ